MRQIADARRVEELIGQLASSIQGEMQRHSALPWALVGIRSRGDLLASRLAEHLGRDRFAGRIGTIDITLYRDDLSEMAAQPVVRTTEVPFPVDGLHIVLVDDVLMTGRSVRAALQQLIDLGRPKRVWLAVLVERGGRELPITSDFAALGLDAGEIAEYESVQVQLRPTDEADAILVRGTGAVG